MSHDQPTASGRSDRDELAGVWMTRGIALLNGSAPDALHEALRCFDQAIELRRKLPLGESRRYGLAAGWINRGDALTRLGGGENLRDAVNSYTAAIGLLQDPPAEDNGLFVRRLAIAWLNRGIALEEQKSEPAEAVHSYEKAIELLSDSPRAADARHNLVLASAWINLGNALLRSPGGAAAAQTCAAAEKALSLLAETESKELAPAEAGFKARHILCQALIVLLAAPSDDIAARMDLIGKTTDTVEDGLILARNWEKAAVTCFRPLATQLFHLGALIYEKHQPHFLAEFLLDHLDPERAKCVLPGNKGWHAIAEESLSRVRCELRSRGFGLLATPQGRRRLETLNELRLAEARLEALC